MNPDDLLYPGPMSRLPLPPRWYRRTHPTDHGELGVALEWATEMNILAGYDCVQLFNLEGAMRRAWEIATGTPSDPSRYTPRKPKQADA